MRPVDGAPGEEEGEEDGDREDDAGAAAVDGEGARAEEGGKHLAEEAERPQGLLQQRDFCPVSRQLLLRGAETGCGEPRALQGAFLAL